MLKYIRIVVIGSLLMAASYSVYSCSYNTIEKSIESPDHRYVVFLFIRDLGATTKASHQVSIYPKGKTLGDSGGNVFVTYGRADIEWSKQDELQIRILKREHIFKQETSYKDVTIKYLDEAVR